MELAMSDTLISVENLSRYYGNLYAVNAARIARLLAIIEKTLSKFSRFIFNPPLS